MDLNILNEYLVVLVVGICLCVGYVIKHSLDFIPNKYIPLIMLVLGTITNVLINLNTGINASVILGGMLSGLASTGLHQAFSRLINAEEE